VWCFPKACASGSPRRGLLRGDPEVLFLDEPATGLDTVAIRDVDELIVGLGRSGVRIFLGSAGGPEMSMIGPGARRWGCGG